MASQVLSQHPRFMRRARSRIRSNAPKSSSLEPVPRRLHPAGNKQSNLVFASKIGVVSLLIVRQVLRKPMPDSSGSRFQFTIPVNVIFLEAEVVSGLRVE